MKQHADKVATLVRWLLILMGVQVASYGFAPAAHAATDQGRVKAAEVNVADLSPLVLKAACAQEVERHGRNASADIEDGLHGVRRKNQVRQAFALPVSPSQFACVASGERVVEGATFQSRTGLVWMFAMRLSRKSLEVDPSAYWSETVLQTN